MKTYKPILEDGCDVTCPLYNTEWYVCNITNSKCPKTWEDKDCEDHFDFPDDCPAKDGVQIKL